MRPAIRAAVVLLATASSIALAAPVTYQVDTRHSHPSFEADHFGGVSVWRGKFSGTSGSIVLDRAAKTGTVDITIDTSTVQTGDAELDTHLKSKDFFDVEKFPAATFKGKITKFKDDAPAEVQGDLTLHGVTKPVTLTLASFKCMMHPMKKGTELCGADAHTTINREDYGIVFGKNFGFDMRVKLAIQIEATATK
jgi:polyisoprenoid-binding protein YceI